MKSRDVGYLEDMRQYAQRALDYVHGLDAAAFAASNAPQDLVIRCLTVIGEAARQVSPDAQQSLPDLDWRAMIRTRDLLVHHYRRIDADELWRIVVRDLPALIDVVSERLKGDL